MNHIPNNNWLIPLDTVDSTNNYAMQMVQDGLAQNGMVVTAEFQTDGKGQRGKKWDSGRADNVVMSMVLDDSLCQDIYHLSFCIPVAVSEALQVYLPNCQVEIKWTNDIYVNDSKLAGILIENVFRGNHLKYAIIGIGINLNENVLDVNKWTAPYTSIFNLTRIKNEKFEIVAAIRNKILELAPLSLHELRELYLSKLWMKGQEYNFEDLATGVYFSAKVLGINEGFQLELLVDDNRKLFNFGTLKWLHQ